MLLHEAALVHAILRSGLDNLYRVQRLWRRPQSRIEDAEVHLSFAQYIQPDLDSRVHWCRRCAIKPPVSDQLPADCFA